MISKSGNHANQINHISPPFLKSALPFHYHQSQTGHRNKNFQAGVLLFLQTGDKNFHIRFRIHSLPPACLRGIAVIFLSVRQL